ncbi:MAG: hypothetical protein ACKV2U_07200 [Bryobacteraceae bacterium]
MRLLLAFLAPLLLAGQEAPKDEKKKEPEAPAVEEPKTGGSVDLGHRWNSDVVGSLDTYRSIVNLGEGPRVLGFQYTLFEAPAKAWDRLDLSAAGWGGDPAAWFRLDASKLEVYRLRLDHRDTAYFNAMPSFANPLLERGIFLNQRAFDTRRRYTDLSLTMRPGKKLSPYFGYTRDSGDGRGITTFVTGGNEYPVANTLDDRTHNYRGGVEWTIGKGHLTLEQGGLVFDDDQRVSTADRNPGNRQTPFLGRQLFLGELLQTYQVNGHSLYSKALGGWQAASWLDLSGSFLYSQPKTDIVYNQLNKGLFADLDTLLFADQQSLRWAAASRQPHSTGNVTAEVRPHERIRILESWFTDRFHNASTFDRLVWNQSRQQLDVLVEASRWLTLRGGHSYTWGDGSSRGTSFNLNGTNTGTLRRHTGTAGGTLRLRPKLTVFADAEVARSSAVLFRTSLADFEKYRVRARYEVSASLNVQANFGDLRNRNPPEFGLFDLRQRQAAAAIQWLPRGGKRVKLIGEYARSSLRSAIDYTGPQSLARERSEFADNGHTVSAFVDAGLRHGATLSVGGASYRSSGSRPSRFHQPQIRLTAPLRKNVHVLAEYRWFSFSQPFYRVELFRTHQFMAGIRVIQ